MGETDKVLPQKVGAARRAQILDVAITLIGKCGYYGVGLQELAHHCGLTKPGLLHHFGSKDQLLLALLEDRDKQNETAVNAMLGPAAGSSHDPYQAREQLLEAFRLI